jgi:hypothetical protein
MMEKILEGGSLDNISEKPRALNLISRPNEIDHAHSHPMKSYSRN